MIISLLLLFVMVLSVSASFAASDDAGDLIAVDDTADDDVDATDDSNQDTLKEAPVVTKDNFNDYFDESGTYSSDEEELVFEGDFSGLDISAITIAGESTVKFTGKNATFKNVQVMIMQDDVTIDGFNFVTDDANPHTRLIHIIGAEEGLSDIVLSNNNITFIGPKNNEAYAIFAGGDTVSGSCEVSGLQIINNNITYVGNSDGTQINNVIRVNGDTEEEWESDGILVQGNNFDIQIPSIKIKYGTFDDAQPFSEAIVFYYCDDVKFIDNKVKIKASDKIGFQDTINVVSAYGDSLMMMTSSNIIISGNEIEGVGGSAIYGIKVSADDFEVTNNKINLSSDEYYANGISIEGPSSNGLVDKNNITLTAPVDKYTSVYGIYTWQMMGSNLNVTYSNNIIDTTGYLACGMEINQPDPVIGTNTITSNGNFTYGIAASIRPASSEGFITNNVINCLGNNVGMGSGDSILKTASAGISTLGKATISGNKINSTSVGIISVDKGEVAIFDNEINVTATGDKDNYAIKVDGVEKLELNNNNITFVGSTDGSSVFTNALRVSDISGEVLIFENNFDVQVPSVDVPWFEVPEGSGNWISIPVSEGIVIEDSDKVIFDGNIVKLEFNDFATAQGYDTIYVVDFKNSNNAIITNNKIKGKGKDYIYGLILSGDNFTIRANNITSSSEFYANGIDIEGPASGVVEDNNISVYSDVSAYGIYSGMNGQDVVANYTGNSISGNAYNVFGFSLGDAKSELVKNEIMLDGNYTTGIAYRGGEAYIKENLIVLMSSEEGDEDIWENFGVETVGVKVLKGNVTVFNNTISTQGKGISIAGNQSNVVVEGNFINVVGNEDESAYAVYVNGAGEVDVVGNTVDYQGTTNGTGINNAVFIYETDGVMIAQNKFNLDLVSAKVNWLEIPEGSWNYVSFPVSEGIVVEDSNDVIFDSNNVTVEYTDVVGSDDTIYSVAFKNSNNAVITNNNITSKGYTYIYGLQVSGDEFVIRANTINSTSEFYANGIDIEGPASGVVEDNNISVYSDVSAYGIYSGMNGQDVVANYTGNSISGNAYNIFGFSLGDARSELVKNEIMLDGNYTTGIAYRGTEAYIKENLIVLISSEEGNETIWEGFGVETVGVKVAQGTVTVLNNTISTQGKGISIAGNESNAFIGDNFINVVGNDDKNAFAIYVNDAGPVIIVDNDVDYEGTTQGAGINNAVFIYETDNAMIARNKFTLDLVSSYVNWLEIPEGSKNYVALPVSEGIVVEDSNGVLFDGNNVTVEYTDVVGSDDTIYSVAFKNSNNAIITNNNIASKGNTYIYGLQVSGDEFIIRVNTINSTGEFYANGIDIEGPASGVVEDNNISVYSGLSAYGIYSGMNGQDVVANYTGNSILGNAYNFFGFSLGDAKSELVKNHVILDGNYTTGIAYYGGEAFLKENIIVLISSEEGKETVWENFGVETVGVKVLKGNVTVFNNTIATNGKGLHIAGNQSNVVVEDNFINVVGNDDKNAFAVYVNAAGDVDIVGNTVEYQGTTKGTGINNAVFIYATDDVIIAQNKFNLDLVSSYVNWLEIPEGSWNYVAFPISEGIVVEDSNNMIFDSNNVTVEYTDVVGSDDTIYSVAFKNSNNSVITNNNIASKGNTYIYGLQVSGEDFIVRANTINTTSNYYANGIDIEGPASGVVEDNTIIAKASNLSYPIYSGMNGKPVSVNITGNDIQGEAYLAIGAEIAGQEAIVKDNNIAVKGNHTMGIASKVDKLNVVNNQILSNASNEGNESIWEAFGTDTAGIKVAGGQATISNNNVKTTGDYAIDVADTNSTIQPNHVESAKGSGVNAVHSTGNATIDVKIKTSITAPASVTVLLTKVKSGYTINVVLKDSDGKVLAKSPITVNGKAFTTDANGAVNYKVSASKVGTQTLNINYAGTDAYVASTAKVTVKITKEKTKLTAKKKTFKAKKKVKKYTVVLKDSKKKAIKNVKVTLKVKGKTYKAKTNSKGKATFKIKNLKKKGTYKAKVKFAGNKYYKASSKSVKIKIKK